MLNPLNPLVLSNGVLRIVLSGDLGSTNGAASTKGVLDISIVGERGSDGTAGKKANLHISDDKNSNVEPSLFSSYINFSIQTSTYTDYQLMELHSFFFSFFAKNK